MCHLSIKLLNAYLLIKRTNGGNMAILWVVIIVILNVISKYLADRYLNNNALLRHELWQPLPF